MLYAKLFVKRRRARGDSSRRPANSAALREKFISTERPASGQGFSMKRRSSRCATVDGFAYCLGGFAADHETVDASSAFRRLTGARRRRVSSLTACRVAVSPQSPLRVLTRRRTQTPRVARTRPQPRSARSRGGAVSCSRDSAHVQGRLSRRERIAFPAEALCGRAIRGDRAPRIGSALPPKALKTFDAWGAVGLRDFCVKNLCGLCVETCSGRVRETFAEFAKHSFRDTPLAPRRGSVFSSKPFRGSLEEGCR